MNLRTLLLRLGLLGVIPVKLCSAYSYSWTDANGSWGTRTNWSTTDPNGGPPNDPGATAIFNQATAHLITVDAGGPYSVGTLNFGTSSLSGYTLRGSGTLNLYSNIINQNMASQNINCSLVLEEIITLTNTNNGQILINGSITGVGGFTLNEGKVIFTNNGNQVTYSGTTTINGSAVFQASDPNVFSPNSAFVLTSTASLVPGGSPQTIGSLTGGSETTVVLDGQTITIGNDNTSTEFDGVIGDFSIDTGGGVVKIGSGTLTLGGNNTYSGNTNITGGILVLNGANTFPDTATVSISSGQLTLGNSSALGSAPLTMANNTTLVLDGGITISNGVTVTGSTNISVASGVGTISGAIGGSGSLTQNGPGTLVLSGETTYVGETILESGTLQLQGSSSLQNSSSVTMASGSTLDMSLTSGSTTINTLSGSGNILIGSQTLTVDQGSNQTYAGVISGLGGSLIKTGSGALTLTGNNTYTGPTTVAQGSLYINGSSASPLNISSGAILRGTGTFSSIILESGATIAPGNSVGIITASSVTFDPGSLFQVEINPSESSLLNVTGTATLAGNVQVVQDAGSYGKQGQYLILEAGSISGAFDPTVLGGSGGYTFSLYETASKIYLLYSIFPISTNGLSGNALKIVNYINDNGDITIITLLNNLNGSTLDSAINTISPARNAFGSYITQLTSFSLSNVVTDYLDTFRMKRKSSKQNVTMAALFADAANQVAPPLKKHEFSAWVSGFGEYAHQKASSQNPSFNYITEAVLGGVDYKGDNIGVAGIGFGYAHSRFIENGHKGHGNINDYFLSLYGNAYVGDLYFSPAIWGLFNQIDNVRNISFPGYFEKAKANIYVWQLVPHLEIGYDIPTSYLEITPFTSLDWAINWQKGYTEHGASLFNATEGAKTSSMVRSETGLKLSKTWDYAWGSFMLMEKASYVFEKPFHTNVTAAFVGTPGSFTVSAVNQNLNLGVVGIDFTTAIGKGAPVSISFRYEGEFGGNYWSNQGTLTISKRF